MSGCDICINPVGVIEKFKTYQPTSGVYEDHFVCKKCVERLVDKHFSWVNVL